MWMMGYTDGADFNMQDSFNGRKLLPRPTLMPDTGNNNSFGTPSLSPQCFRTINGPDLLSFNHHINVTNQQQHQHQHHQQQQQVVASSRWNPTPEQLQTLEELYRSGTRTPSADQIQYITAQLRRYGKIEGKNVFYWFQNHKARERHKRRRHQLESVLSSDEHQNQHQHQHQHQFGCILNSERRELEVNRRAVIEVEETKGCIPSSTNSSSTLAEKSISMVRPGAKARSEYKTDGWIQFHEQGEILQLDKNDTWQMMQFLSCGQETNIVRAIMCPKILNIPTNDDVTGHNHDEVTVVEGVSKTLQLFPLQSGSHEDVDDDDDESMSEKPTDMLDSTLVRGNLSSNAPCQFFEFLPLKN